MSSTGRSDARSAHPGDLYQTPGWFIRGAVAAGALSIDSDPTHVFWEPCAGRGAIVRELIALGVEPDRIWASDIDLDLPDDLMGVRLAEIDINGATFSGSFDIRDTCDSGDTWVDFAMYGSRRTVITNPPFRIEDRPEILGFEGADLHRRIPPVRGGAVCYRDGVAAAFWAGVAAGASVIALVTRVGWWTGSGSRRELRQMIRRDWQVEIWSTARRVRFLKPDGTPTGGSDSCEHCLLVFKRRAMPLSDAELSARPVPAQARDQHIEFEDY